MRQAGRYLPEYREVRRSADFLTMVRTPELATEVTLQPVRRFALDAAIIFSDILVVPTAMGMHLIMEEGSGPHFPEPVRSRTDVARLRVPVVQDEIAYTLDAIRMTRVALADRVTLIGFAGAPWTLASYMIEGQGTKHFHTIKQMVYSDPTTVHALLDRLTPVIAAFLEAQVAAGAQLLQVFDSWAGALGPIDYQTFGLPYLAEIVRRVRRETGVPVIVFAPGAGASAAAIVEATGADVLGIDWQTAPGAARRLCGELGVASQGNLDPCALFGTPEAVRDRTTQMLEKIWSPGHIANLGHGILPNTPVENMRAFVDAVCAFQPG
jgi:uroporphyrinogen decarboxylase